MKLDIIPVKWSDEGVLMLDQRLLPTATVWLTLKTYDEVAAGIKDMVVRGAPAIGVSAAYGMAIAAKNFVGTTGNGSLRQSTPANWMPISWMPGRRFMMVAGSRWVMSSRM